MIMQSDAVQVSVNEPVATIVLNRPQRRNALTRAMIAQLREALRDAYHEKRVRAVVLTGAGSAFCAGRDVHEMLASDDDEPADLKRWGEEAEQLRELILEMLELPKPIIASVNGPAVAAGAGLVLAADVVVASDDALFGFPDPRLGVVAGVEAPLVAFRLGAGAAARLLLTGELLPAEEALRMGVYHELADHRFLWSRAVEIAQQCAAGSPQAIHLTKRVLLETAGEQLATQLTSGAIATASSRTTESARQGLQAFIDKRRPEWP